MKKILQSQDYERFTLMPNNRDVKKIKALEDSMRLHGWIDAYPIHVIEIGPGKYRIKAGNHRFQAAKKLRIAVKYVVCDDNITIHELEKATNPWKIEDYLASFCREGLEDYLIVKDYREKTGIALQNAILMLGGQTAGAAAMMPSFKDGSFKALKDCDHADKVAGISLLMKECGIKFHAYSPLIQAISMSLMVKEFDINHFKGQIRKHHWKMEKRGDIGPNLEMLENLYNRMNKNRIPLKNLATWGEARRRASRRVSNLKGCNANGNRTSGI